MGIGCRVGGCSVRLQTLGVLLWCLGLAWQAGAESEAELVFSAFDLETTGFSAADDRIVEIGLVQFCGADVRLATNWLINPGMPMPPIAQRVHGISDAMVADSPSFTDVYPCFADAVSGTVLLAHNALFDMRFLAAETVRSGQPLPAEPVVDTLRLFREWFPNAPGHSMDALMQYFDLDHGRLHRAEEDADCVRRLLLKGMEAGRELPSTNHPAWLWF